MENGQLSNQTNLETESGTFRVPSVLKAPKLFNINDVPEIEGVFCYIIEHYGYSGWGCMIAALEGYTYFKFSDWDGNELDINSVPTAISSDYVPKLTDTLRYAGVSHAMFFFDVNCNLVDAQTSVHKMLGPGMINDIFGKSIPIYTKIDLKILDKDDIAELPNNIIIKPSKFRSIVRDELNVPCYIEKI